MVTLTTEKIGFNERLFLLVSRQALTLKHFNPIEKIDLNVYFYISLHQQGVTANVLAYDIICIGINIVGGNKCRGKEHKLSKNMALWSEA